jgi:hypothetical protein
MFSAAKIRVPALSARSIVTYIVYAFALFVGSSVAIAKVSVRDVSLKNNFFDKNAITAEVIGQITHSCVDLANSEFTLSPSFIDANEINIYVDTDESNDAEDQVCRELPESFVKSVELGMLEPGYYTLKLFENGATTFTKGFLVPFDVKTVPWGLDLHRSIGERRHRTSADKKS